MDLVHAPAPDFILPRDGGGAVTLGRIDGCVVIYFYPRDDTAGCTAQALDFTARAADFAATGATILGISTDSVATHDSFREKHGLGIALLSDADATVSRLYGVWTEKMMYGRTHMGIERSTFLVAPDKTIARVWRKVRVPGHVADVLAATRSL